MTRHLHFDPSREPLPPDEEMWGSDGLPSARDGDVDGAGDAVGETSAAAETEAAASDDALDAALRTLARESYHVRDATAPQSAATYDDSARIPRDAMWAAIAARRASQESIAKPSTRNARPVTVHALTPRQSRRFWQAFAALAATLLVGVIIGRGISDRGDSDSSAPALAASERGGADRDSSRLPLMLAELTSQHFASTEALLVTARQEMDGTNTDASVAAWARDLLMSTRLLLDTESLQDLRIRRLLQDLELTLALIVQAQSSGRDADAQTVREDLDRGDLLLRVRSAAMPTVNSPNDIRGMSE